jgi:hypothetical protein
MQAIYLHLLISRSMPVFSNVMCVLLDIVVVAWHVLLRRVPDLTFRHDTNLSQGVRRVKVVIER